MNFSSLSDFSYPPSFLHSERHAGVKRPSSGASLSVVAIELSVSTEHLDFLRETGGGANAHTARIGNFIQASIRTCLIVATQFDAGTPAHALYPHLYLQCGMLHAADADSQISVAWGITVGLIASFVQSLGLTVQRKSHVLNEQLPEELQCVEYRRPSVYFLLYRCRCPR